MIVNENAHTQCLLLCWRCWFIDTTAHLTVPSLSLPSQSRHNIPCSKVPKHRPSYSMCFGLSFYSMSMHVCAKCLCFVRSRSHCRFCSCTMCVCGPIAGVSFLRSIYFVSRQTRALSSVLNDAYAHFRKNQHVYLREQSEHMRVSSVKLEIRVSHESCLGYRPSYNRT